MNPKNSKPFKIINSWKHYLNEGQLSEVLQLYNLNCILIPTFSSEILKDHGQIKEYFVKMIEVQKGKVKFQSNSISEQQLDENIYLLSGKYFFYLLEKKKIPARFSFLVNPFNDNPIMHHHSSLSRND
tara:strand:+ start:1017 stop:1400 length:384 start_codon:yes stop_codon:yes gene_type:complete